MTEIKVDPKTIPDTYRDFLELMQKEGEFLISYLIQELVPVCTLGSKNEFHYQVNFKNKYDFSALSMDVIVDISSNLLTDDKIRLWSSVVIQGICSENTGIEKI